MNVTSFDLYAQYLNPLVSAAYRALESGADLQILWNDAKGYPVDPYPGQKSFNQTWETVKKYDVNFEILVDYFEEHFRLVLDKKR